MPETKLIQPATVEKNPFMPQGSIIGKSQVITAGQFYDGATIRLFPRGALMALVGTKLVRYVELGGGANTAIGALKEDVLMDQDITLDIECTLVISSTAFKISECDNWGTGTAATDPIIRDNFHLIT